MTTRCQHCDHELDDDARFCSECGGAVMSGSGPDDTATPGAGEIASPATAPEQAPVWSPEHSEGPVVAAAPAGSWDDQPAPPVDGTVGQAQVVSPEPGSAPGNPPPPPGESSVPLQPPEYGSHPGPPTFGGPGQTDPTNPQFTSGESDSKRGGAAKFVGIGLAVLGVAAIAVVALRFITGGDSVAGGASSPESVVEEMVAAVNAQDPLAAVSLMAPDELDGVDDLAQETTAYFDEIGLDELTLDDPESSWIELDLEADRIDVSMEGDDAAVVAFELSGRAEVTGDGDGVFAFLDPSDGSFDASDLEEALPNGSDEIELIVVKLDGKWFASPMLTIGHYVVENGDLPSGEYDAIGKDRDPGADSSEDAVNALIDVINDPDADDLAAALGGGEGRVARVFRDAIDEGFSEIGSDTSYDISVSTEDLGDGRVGLTEIRFDYDDDFGDFSFTIEDDCVSYRDDDESNQRECLLDNLELDNADDIDTSLFLDTVDEDGGRRVRIVPTITDVLGRYIGLIDDRQTLLLTLGAPQFDTASTVAPGNDVEIQFDGQLYAVEEFEIEEGESYNVAASDGTKFDLYVDDGYGLLRQYDDSFVADGDGTARVVVYSDIDGGGDIYDCSPFAGCMPSGEGEATVRIRQAARQSAEFPTVISGELGPGDSRLFELEVTETQSVRIDVTGEHVDWMFVDAYAADLGGGEYELDPGTYELLVTNTSGDDPTSYEITPTPA